MQNSREIRGVWVPGSWALVLAGGEGGRLQGLTTTPNGVMVPKQFCSLRRGPSLLTQALLRAGAVAPTIQTCAVVAASHRWWWEAPLGALSRENIFVQPDDRGTANGVLMALLRLEARDPRAIVLMMPADHFIQHEALFARSLRQATELAARMDDRVYLLGAEPSRADTELGYIVPADRDRNRPSRVMSLVEKPDAQRAQGLVKMGALWNMVTMAGSVHALLDLYDASYGSSVALIRSAINRRRPPGVDASALAAVYRRLPPTDFLRDVLEPQATRLQVLGAVSCGWNDLGTARRVVETLETLTDDPRRIDALALPSAVLSLADQYRRLRGEDVPPVGHHARAQNQALTSTITLPRT